MFTTLISAQQLAGHLNDPNWRVIDCRFSLADTEAGRRAYAQGHIPGALYAHLDEDLCAPIIPGQTGRHPLPDKDFMTQKFSSWGIDESVQVVAYDDKTGMVASRLWWMLRSLGHTRVAVLDGGFAGLDGPARCALFRWMFRPSSRESFQSGASNCDRHSGPKRWTASGRTPPFVLVDSREAFRYRGESEPIDPVAGHIPGALNAFFMENLDEEGRFLPAEQLRQRFLPLLDGRPAEQSVFYCGSGVSACHNLLAIAHAGLGDAGLYAGSWSEWITDPQRPVGGF
jgi:thiosulfate/3-mercaptopyruvate sulfurtransferase